LAEVGRHLHIFGQIVYVTGQESADSLANLVKVVKKLLGSLTDLVQYYKLWGKYDLFHRAGFAQVLIRANRRYGSDREFVAASLLLPIPRRLETRSLKWTLEGPLPAWRR
jgi:hypothetical protein